MKANPWSVRTLVDFTLSMLAFIKRPTSSVLGNVQVTVGWVWSIFKNKVGGMWTNRTSCINIYIFIGRHPDKDRMWGITWIYTWWYNQGTVKPREPGYFWVPCRSRPPTLRLPQVVVLHGCCWNGTTKNPPVYNEQHHFWLLVLL